MHLIDVEVVRGLIDIGKSGIATSSDVHVSAFGYAADSVPFVGGRLVLGHAAALAVLRDDHQERGNASFNRQVQYYALHMGSPHTSVMLGSGLQAHRNARKMMAAAWPMLTQRQSIILPALPESVAAKIENTGFSKVAVAAVLEDVGLWFIEANLDHLFPTVRAWTSCSGAHVPYFCSLAGS